MSTSERGFGLEVRAVLRPAWDRNESAAWAVPLTARRKGRRLLRALVDGEPALTLGAAGRDGKPGRGPPVARERDWRVGLWLWVSENVSSTDSLETAS